VIPATTSPGLVTLLDNATSIPVFVGGASSVSNLVPFFIPLGMISVSGAWKITTGPTSVASGPGTSRKMFWQPRQGLIAGRGALNPASTPLPVTWDSATITAVTLSGGDLVATNTGTSAVNQGAHVNFSPGKTSGKWYVEIAFTTITSGSGSNLGVGLGTTTSNYSQMGASALTGNMCYQSGNLWANNASTGVSLGARSSGDVIAIAIDLDNRKIWFKKVNATAGNWNNNGSADPATNVGGPNHSGRDHGAVLYLWRHQRRHQQRHHPQCRGYCLYRIGAFRIYLGMDGLNGRAYSNAWRGRHQTHHHQNAGKGAVGAARTQRRQRDVAVGVRQRRYQFTLPDFRQSIGGELLYQFGGV
jgi:hypothetical protein